jgi:hypothetical protein
MKTGSIFPSRYLRASDLQGRRVTVTIEKVVMEDVGGKEQPVMSFKNKGKMLVLNRTNIKTCEEIAGTDETDNWKGVTIILYPTRVDYQGRRVDAIRIDRPSNKGNVTGGTAAEEEEGAF